MYIFPLQIWVQSSHNASGYFTIYGDESDYADHFSASLVTGNTGEVYARTGYLGFLRRTECAQQQGGAQLSGTTTLLGGSMTAIGQPQGDAASGGEEDDTPGLAHCHAAATAASATSGLAAHWLLSTALTLPTVPYTDIHCIFLHVSSPVDIFPFLPVSYFNKKNEIISTVAAKFKQYCQKGPILEFATQF